MNKKIVFYYYLFFKDYMIGTSRLLSVFVLKTSVLQLHGVRPQISLVQ